jgi:hypothetical protein
VGTRHQRKLRKYSDGFNEKFFFFLKCYRTKILTFCGEDVQVEYSKEGVSSREGFRMYDDGYYSKGKNKMVSSQPRIMEAVIRGKKSWGLWVQQWTDGIVDWTFTEEEILGQFYEKDIKIPESFYKDFQNVLEKKKRIRNLKYLEEIENNKR